MPADQQRTAEEREKFIVGVIGSSNGPFDFDFMCNRVLRTDSFGKVQLCLIHFETHANKIINPLFLFKIEPTKV